jgi:NADPH:quinone reductase
MAVAKREALPAAMRAVELRAYDGAVHVVERPLPRLRSGELLVRIAAAPINPSDLMFIEGRYGVRKPLPVVPGFEGAGTVVASGGGFAARALVGRRVACGAPDGGDGTWAEYLVTSPRRCFLLRPGISDEAGATLLINPVTAWVLMQSARRDKHRAVAQTAAAGAIGRMLLRLSLRHKLPMVHIVRRPAQAALLRSLGAEHVLDSSRPEFTDALAQSFQKLGVTLAFDAVAGEMTGTLLRALPAGGRVMVYGALAEEPCAVEPGALIFGQRAVGGFWLSDWLRGARPLEQARAGLAVQRLLGGALKTEVAARLPLERAAEALERYAKRMTEGKVLLVPSRAQRRLT